jgi:FkbM family methyltransferase
LTRALAPSHEGYAVEPTPVFPTPPTTPSGGWLTRTVRAVWREHRWPTRLEVARDRVLVALGHPLKTLHVHGCTIQVRRQTADEHFVREVFVQREYTRPGYEINQADVVIDVGGNIGSFALLAATQARAGKVVVLEPVAENFELLQRNIRANGLDNVIAEPCALMAEPGPVVMHLSAAGTGSHSAIAELAGPSAATQTVEAWSLQDLFQRHGIERCQFLKLDCEGAEFEIVRTLAPPLAARIDKIVAEYHTRPQTPKRSQADQLLADRRLYRRGRHEPRPDLRPPAAVDD